jgi:hypothetical protein
MDDAASHRTGDSRQNKQEPLEISQFKFMLLPALSKAAATVPPPMAAVATVAMPAWVALCGNMAPVVSMAVFFAVGLRTRKIHAVIIDHFNIIRLY